MPVYRFSAKVGAHLSGTEPTAPAILAELQRLGLAQPGVRVARRGQRVTLDGQVPDAEARERLVLAVGNLAGIGEVEDRLTMAQQAGLLDALGGFARLPAGSASTQAAGASLHAEQPEAGTWFGPGGSLFHTVQPGEDLALLAERHWGSAAEAARLAAANAPLLPAGNPPPGWVLRIPRE